MKAPGTEELPRGEEGGIPQVSMIILGEIPFERKGVLRHKSYLPAVTYNRLEYKAVSEEGELLPPKNNLQEENREEPDCNTGPRILFDPLQTLE